MDALTRFNFIFLVSDLPYKENDGAKVANTRAKKSLASFPPCMRWACAGKRNILHKVIGPFKFRREKIRQLQGTVTENGISHGLSQ